VDATILSLTGTAEKELPSTFRKHFFATIPRQRCFPFRGGLVRARISDWRGMETRRIRYENHQCKCRSHDRRVSLLSAVPSAKAQSGKGMNSLVPLELLGGIVFSPEWRAFFCANWTALTIQAHFLHFRTSTEWSRWNISLFCTTESDPPTR
jgi:hypothetical protein